MVDLQPRDRPEEPETEIEITPAMIEAGAAVLCSFETLTAGEEYWARKTYLAMRKAARRRSDAQKGA